MPFSKSAPSYASIVQAIGLGLLFFVVGYYSGITKAKVLSSKEMIPLVADGYQQSLGLYFSFVYPTGWHVFSDGDIFYLDEEPLFDFPHQKYKLIEGRTTNEKEKVLADLKKNKAFTSVDTFKAFYKTECFQKTEKEVEDGPFPSLDGQVLCLVDVPWGESTIITYVFTANNTNVAKNFVVLQKFIESIQNRN